MTSSPISSYQFDLLRRLYVPESGEAEADLQFSVQEFDVLSILNEVADLTHGSEELLERIETPTQRFHLSPERANLLQPHKHLLVGDVLVLGAGNGPLARFLAENGAHVRSVEPTRNLAIITGARCRDLDVGVYVAGEESFPSDITYDAIVLTAPLPAQNLSLRHCVESLKKVLKPGGVVVLGISNRLRMAPLSKDANGASSYSWSVTKASLETTLHHAGLHQFRLAYVFPTWETARLIIQPKPLRSYPPGLEDVLAAYDGRAGAPPGEPFWQAILENDLLPYVSKAFLVLASDSPLPPPNEREILSIYSSSRRKHFSRVTRIEEDVQSISVARLPLFPDAPVPPASPFRRRTYQEPYWEGKPYLGRLQSVMGRPQWTVEEIGEWARPWLDLLQEQATREMFQSYIGGFRCLLVLPTSYLDCIPSNILVRPDGALVPFDFEYEALAPIPLAFVAFRGLYYALTRVTPAVSNSVEKPGIVDLTLRIMQLSGIEVEASELQNYVETEAALQDSIAGAPAGAVAAALRASVLGSPDTPSAQTGPPPRLPVLLELFWKSKDVNYSTANSRSAVFTPEKARQTIQFTLPASSESIDYLRLDPADRTGMFYLFSLKLNNAAGQCIWSWRGGQTHPFAGTTKDVSFTDVPMLRSCILLLSESADPNFELAIPPNILAELQSGGRFEVDMSWPESEEAVLLSSRILDTKSYRARISALELENAALVEENARNVSLQNIKQEAADRLVAEERQQLEAALQKTNQRLAKSSLELAKALQAREAAVILNRELQEQLRTVKDYLKTVSLERDTLQQQLEVMGEMQIHIDQLTARLNCLEQAVAHGQEQGSSSVSVSLSDLQHRVEELTVQGNHLEQLVMGIFTGRIWRTLGTLGSPVKLFLRSGRK